MSDTIGDGSYEDYLAHYGVRGMRWGKRGAGNGGAPKQTSKERTAEIKAARKKIAEQVQRHDNATYQSLMGVTAKERQKGRDTASKILRELDESGLDKIASKYTRGEKIASALILGATGAMVVSTYVPTRR